MLKQFAPSVVIPPSPKNNAWSASAIDSDSIPPQGPSTMPATAIPTACAVVPPGRGRLNIITTNENAANTEIRGMVRVINCRLILRNATYHPDPESAYSAAHVDGLRYPSGMCTRPPPLLLLTKTRSEERAARH